MGEYDLIEGEKSSLELHVNLCQRRYEQIDTRLTKIEQKLDDLSQVLDKSRHELGRIILASATTLFSGIIGLIITLIVKL